MHAFPDDAYDHTWVTAVLAVVSQKYNFLTLYVEQRVSTFKTKKNQPIHYELYTPEGKQNDTVVSLSQWYLL